MTFLTMAAWQAWLALGLTAAAVTIIFFLRIQHRRVLVSSSLLWERVLEKRKRRSWLEILRRLLSLLIALAIGLALAGVLAGAERGGAGLTPRSVRVVIDNSVSMAALRADGRTRLEAARDLAGELLDRGSAADTFTLMDRTGRVLAPATRDRRVVAEALAGIAPTAEPRALPALEAGTETWLLTDGVGLGTVPEGLRLVSLFEPADNAAVTAFEIRATPRDPFRHEAFLEVANYSPGPRQVRVEMRDERGVQFRRDLELEGGGLYRNTFDLDPLEGGPLMARVALQGDALSLDDEAWVRLPQRRVVRLLRVAAGASRVDEILAAEPHVELARMTPAEYGSWLAPPDQTGSPPASAPEPFDAVVFDGWAPVESPPVRALVIGAQSTPWLPALLERVQDPGPADAFLQDPLLRFVDLHDLHVEAAVRVVPAGARVLVAAGDLPLVVAGGDAVPWVMTSFALDGSDLTQTLGFPILVSNFVEWVRDEPPVVRAAPGRIAIALPGARIFDAAGAPLGSHDLGDRVVFQAVRPGLYSARARTGTTTVSVAAGGRSTSAINASALGATGSPLEGLPPHRVLWPALLGLAAVLLVAEGLTYHRRVTV